MARLVKLAGMMLTLREKRMQMAKRDAKGLRFFVARK